METKTQYEDSVVGHILSQEMQEMKTTFSTEVMSDSFTSAKYLEQEEIVAELLRDGPFSLERSFRPSRSLRYRYELERIDRAWTSRLTGCWWGIAFHSRHTTTSGMDCGI